MNLKTYFSLSFILTSGAPVVHPNPMTSECSITYGVLGGIFVVPTYTPLEL